MLSPDPLFAVLALLIPLLIYGAIPATLLYLAIRFVRAYERRTAPSDEMAARMALLEEQVARLGTEVDRVSEGQRFTNALLAERGAEAGVR